MQKRALLFDPNEYPGGVFGDIDIVSSSDAIPSFLEVDSFSGSELAFMEDGERLQLTVQQGREYKDIWGREKYIGDFKYVEVVHTGDYSEVETLRGAILAFLARRSVKIDSGSSIEQLVNSLVFELGSRAR